jgi:chromosome segregation ATPase
MNDLLDFNRCADESSKLGGSVPNLKRDVGTCQMQLNNLKDTRERLAMEVETLRKLMDTGNALWQDATRLSAKKIDVEEKLKDEETSVGTGSFLDTRSLATVESELFDRLKKKDLLSDEISKLNKEMSDLNNEITSLTTKVRLTSSGVRIRERIPTDATCFMQIARHQILINESESLSKRLLNRKKRPSARRLL